MIPVWNIKKTTVVTTSEVSTKSLIKYYGNPIQSVFIDATLKSIGMDKAVWFNLGKIKSSAPEERAEFLRQIKSHLLS